MEALSKLLRESLFKTNMQLFLVRGQFVIIHIKNGLDRVIKNNEQFIQDNETWNNSFVEMNMIDKKTFDSYRHVTMLRYGYVVLFIEKDGIMRLTGVNKLTRRDKIID